MIKVIRLLMVVVTAWAAFSVWHAIPFFSQGFGVGVSHIGTETQELLNDFALAGERLMYFARMRRESIEYPQRMGTDRPQPRRFESLQELDKE